MQAPEDSKRRCNSGNSWYIRFLRMTIIMEISCTKKHKVVSGIDKQGNYNFDKLSVVSSVEY